MTLVLTYPSNSAIYVSGGSGVMSDQTAIALVNFTTTASGVVIGPNNLAATPVSYTFISTPDQYQRIFSAQCDRVSAFVYSQLEQLDHNDDDQNEEVIDTIAEVMDLVGEPAVGTILMEARVLKGERYLFERLLLAIGTARHKETEGDRLQLLQQYTDDSDYRVRHAAVRALGRMSTEGAKSALREISTGKNEGELRHFAAALLR